MGFSETKQKKEHKEHTVEEFKMNIGKKEKHMFQKSKIKEQNESAEEPQHILFIIIDVSHLPHCCLGSLGAIVGCWVLSVPLRWPPFLVTKKGFTSAIYSS